MGQSLHDYLLANEDHIACRIYAPVGVHEDLLPYLVRRLLENGANSSFVNQISRSDADLEALSQPVIQQVRAYRDAPRNTHIPLPCNIYPLGRLNAKGFEISDRHALNGIVICHE